LASSGESAKVEAAGVGVVDPERAGGLASSGWVASTYFAQGLPYSIVHQVASQFFTALGVPLSQIGLTSLYGLAWNLKFAWSPLVDRTSTPRRWVVGMQLALGLAVLGLAWPAGRGDVGAVAWGLVVLAVLAATHDVAIDGFYLRALGKTQQASLSGLRVAAYRAALLVGNGALVALGGHAGFFWAFVAAAVILVAIAAVHARLLPAIAEDSDAEKAKEADFLRALTSFFEQPKAIYVIGFILLFRAGDAMMFAMSTPLLRALGLETTARGIVSGIGGTLASVVGSMLGAAFIARSGLKRTLVPIALAQSIAILLYVALAVVKPATLGIVVIVLAEQLIAGVGTAAFVVFLTRRCVGASRAAHFAIATSLMSVAGTAAGAASGYIAEWVGFPVLFALAFVASIPGVLLARTVPAE
jgi:PAT family beta-lactamase induction signal transducer AmpG